MLRVSAFAAALTIAVASTSQASLTSLSYSFYPTGSSDSIGTISLDYAPVENTAGWVLQYSYNLDPNIASFTFDFSSVGGPLVTLPQFNHLFPIPGDPLVSLSGAEIDSGVLIGDSNTDQGQWGMSSTPGFDQARWISGGGSTPTILGDWREAPEPATLTLLALGAVSLLRRR